MQPIAIIGMGCRLPGADTPQALWNLLIKGGEAIAEIPPDRWNIDEYYDVDSAKPGAMSTRWGGFVDRLTDFDCQFFGISPREAPHIDPQQRLLLETTWEALENAGIVPGDLAGKPVGVFIGVMNPDYQHLQMSDHDLLNPHSGPGIALCITANRLSYVYNFQGPSLALDTACSSSLYAVHLACQSLQDDESSPIALAGGVNALIDPAAHIFFSKAGVMAPDGRTRAFAAGSTGFARGEGAGVLILKRLDRALADGDPIHAVIRGTAVNQDGRTNGIMAPSRWAQETVLRTAYRRAGLNPGDVQYVETHGTGTTLGDLIEANALGSVMGEGRTPGSACIIGSVKSNIGHLESAAGMAGIIKVVQMLQHRIVVPSLHTAELNPHIAFDKLPIRVAQRLEPWPETQDPARASVSGFGFGGSNAHVVLEGAPAHPVEPRERARSDAPMVLPLSAHNESALNALANAYAAQLVDSACDAALADICHTAGVRRTHHEHRLALVCRSKSEAASMLREYLSGNTVQGLAADQRSSGKGKPVFICAGQGPQWWAMGRGLLQAEPVFRAAIEECASLLRTYVDWDLCQELLADEPHSRLQETEIAQPALFALQVGLAALWRSWGIVPGAVVGHSLGEVTAAYLSGALSLADALRLVAHRGRILQRTTGRGRMIAIKSDETAITALLADLKLPLSVAAVNGPQSVVVAGETTAIAQLLPHLDTRAIRHQSLPVNYAFHSPLLDPLQGELAELLAGLTPGTTTIPLISTRTGEVCKGPELTAGYWAEQMRGTVRYADAITTAAKLGFQNFVELSPHPTLQGATSQVLSHLGKAGTVLPSLRRGEPDAAVMYESLSHLYALGHSVNWHVVNPPGQLVAVPTYPWQRERAWYPDLRARHPKTLPVAGTSAHADQNHPFLRRHLALSTASNTHVWEGELDLATMSYLNDHQVQGAVVMPGVVYLEMALAAARQWLGLGSFIGTQLQLDRALFLRAETKVTLQAVLERTDTHAARFRVYSRPTAQTDGAWTLHASGHIARLQTPDPGPVDLANLASRASTARTHDEFYAAAASYGLQYGPTFRAIQRVWVSPTEALAELRIPEAIRHDTAAYHFHPALLDAGAHLLLALADPEANPGANYIPVGVDEVCLYNHPAHPVWSHAVRAAIQPDGGLAGDVTLYDRAGRPVAAFKGMRFRQLESPATHSPTDWLYQVQWRTITDLDRDQHAPVGPWLIFADSSGIAQQLAERLRTQGQRAHLVYPGESWVATADRWQIRPDQPEDLQRLLQEIGDVGTIAYLWPLDIPDSSRPEPAQAAPRLSYDALVHLVQAIGHATRKAPRLWIITRGAQATSPVDPFSPGQAPLWGLGRTLVQEHPELQTRLLDLDPTQHAESGAKELWAAMSLASREDQVALRGGQLLVPRLTSLAPKGTRTAPALSPEATYLITGGLGDLGLLIAQWAVARGARHLLLMGRAPLPARSAWDEVPADSRPGRQIAAIRALEKLGASVYVAAADVADKQQLADCLKQFRAQGHPPIRGLFHLAGSVALQTVMELDTASLNATLGPKVWGSWHLHELLHDLKLDLFVLFSSASAILHSPRLGAYAAANAYLDALAHYRHHLGLPALAIDWGPWSTVGMATRAESPERSVRRAMGTIEPAQGLALLDSLLDLNQPQVAVLPIDWPRWQRQYAGAAPMPLLNDLLATLPVEDASTTAPTAIRLAVQAAPPEAQPHLLEEYLAAQLSAVLQLPPERIDRHQSILGLGADSLMLAELKSHIERDTGIGLALVDLLQGPSIHTLAQVLQERIQQSAPAETDAAIAPETLLAQLGALSDEQVEALLRAEMDQLAKTSR